MACWNKRPMRQFISKCPHCGKRVALSYVPKVWLEKMELTVMEGVEVVDKDKRK